MEKANFQVQFNKQYVCHEEGNEQVEFIFQLILEKNFKP